MTYKRLIIAIGALCGVALLAAQNREARVGSFDWQGHRGARGLAPENSIPAFLKALEFDEVTTLEMDVAVSADGQVVVSHDPWISALFCSHPDGKAVAQEEEGQFVLYQLPYSQIRGFDTGIRGNARFPEQVPQKAYKPTLEEVVERVADRCSQQGRAWPNFNIEIKSKPAWDGVQTPEVEVFVRLVVDKVAALNLEAKVCIQSFDIRALQQVRRINPDLTLALLVENTDSMQKNLRRLGFVPQIYSPYFELLDKQVVRKAHRLAMRVIPWTVNDTATMNALIQLGVDGIITDYPNRIPK